MGWLKLSTWLECSETTNLCPSSGLSNDPKRWIKLETYSVLDSFKGEESNGSSWEAQGHAFLRCTKFYCAMQHSLPEVHHMSVFQDNTLIPSLLEKAMSVSMQKIAISLTSMHNLKPYHTKQVYISLLIFMSVFTNSSPTSKAMTYIPSHILEWISALCFLDV